MKTKRLFAVLVLAAVAAAGVYAQDSIVGLWKQIDDKTGKPDSLVYIYEYQGKLFGRMIASYEDDGKIGDTIYIKKYKADKLAGDPAYCGLDYVYNLELKGKEYRGAIMDPRDAKEYDCRVWKEGSKLIVRGQIKGLGFLGRNQTWVVASSADLPEGFQMPDPRTFIPVIPKKK